MSKKLYLYNFLRYSDIKITQGKERRNEKMCNIGFSLVKYL